MPERTVGRPSRRYITITNCLVNLSDVCPPLLVTSIHRHIHHLNIRFLGVKIWNVIEDDCKTKSRSCFKTLITSSILDNYKS